MTYKEKAMYERELYLAKMKKLWKERFMNFLIEKFRTSNIAHFDRTKFHDVMATVPIYELVTYAKEEGFHVRSVRANSLDVILNG